MPAPHHNPRTPLRLSAAVLSVTAIGFILFALHHPECSWPWNNTLTCVLYALFLATLAGILLRLLRK